MVFPVNGITASVRRMYRIGVIGNGLIARAVMDLADASPRMEVAFVCSRSGGTTPSGLRVRQGEPEESDLRDVDLVVEAAHPDVVAAQGERVLRHADLLAVSTGALADQPLVDRLTRTAEAAGTRLVVPQGALVGLDAVVDQAHAWTEATITMVKAPGHLDPAPRDVTTPTVLHDGPVAPLVQRFPRNVNAMVSFALATLGPERTRCRLVCDPRATLGQIEMSLRAADGTSLHVTKKQPMVGVSGSEMPASVRRSLINLTGTAPAGLVFA